MAGFPGQNATWDMKCSDALKAHVAAGFSFSQCAMLLNDEFGTSYTRNATIGRANRLGMQRSHGYEERSLRERVARKNKPKIRIVAANGNSNRKRVIEVTEAEEAPLRCVEVIPRGISLSDLEPGDCRYPYGDSPFTFCGHSIWEGSSYCAAHHALSRRVDRNLSEEERHRRRLHFIKISGLNSVVPA